VHIELLHIQSSYCLHAYDDMQDPTHRGAVIIRFEEDNSRIWLPAEEVRRFLVEDECGEQVDDARADTLAAQVLVSLSGRSSADDFSQVCLQNLLLRGQSAGHGCT